MDYWTIGLWLFRRWAPHFSNNIHLDAHLGWLKWSLTGMYINALYPVCNHRNISAIAKGAAHFLLVGAILQLQLSLHSPFFWPRIKSAMWSKSCHKPAMTGNGLNPTYKNGNDWGMNYGIVLPTLTGDCYNNGHGGWCKWHCFTNSIIAIARPSTIIDHHRPSSTIIDPWPLLALGDVLAASACAEA